MDGARRLRDAGRMLALLVLLFATPVSAQEIDVQPYVQDRQPTSAWILWETTSGDESRVEWGTTETLGTTSTGTALTTEGSFRVHEVELSPLAPATRYYYRALTGTASSAVYHFTTPPLPAAEATFQLVAVSDMQRDAANPGVWGRIVHEGILAFVADEAPLPDEALSLVLVPGDLVDDGTEHARWVDEYFAPAADLMSYVPFYPVIGNHERDHHFYDDFVRMPDVGPSTDRDFYFDHGNVRIIGLDSNQGLLGGTQAALLEEALTGACTAEAIDFVFVEMHHPFHSELWPAGEAIFSRMVVERVDAFARDCGRPAVFFYGHTHAYARGASRDAPHLWVNVATAGGNIDTFGEYGNQYDDPETQVSQDEWGFVVMDVEAGADPRLRLRRFGMGNETTAATRVLRDELTLRRYGEPPSTPTARAPRGRVAPSCLATRASAFSDPDGDAHFAAHVQLARACDAFEHPIVDLYEAAENVYGGIDRSAGDDLTSSALSGLAEGTYYCWRVRYRDANFAWSEWSAPLAFELRADGAPSCEDDTMLTPPSDAGVGPDAASHDAATLDAASAAPATASGCACRASSAPRPALGAALGLAWLVTWRARRRARRS